MNITSNYEVPVVETAKKYINQEFCLSLIALTMLDPIYPDLNININFNNEFYMKRVSETIKGLLLRCDSNKVLLKTQIHINEHTSEFIDNIPDVNPETSEYINNIKVIANVYSNRVKIIFKFYRLNSSVRKLTLEFIDTTPSIIPNTTLNTTLNTSLNTSLNDTSSNLNTILD